MRRHLKVIGIVGMSLLTVTGISNGADVPLSGGGTESSPYLVSTVSDWNGLASYIAANGDNLAGKFVALTADIDFKYVDFTPISEFNGTFDGAKFSLLNIEYTTTAAYQGVFGTIGAEATVKNLTAKGNISSANSYTGGLAGLLKGKMSDCKSVINITSSANYAGGVMGKADDKAVVENCCYEGELTSGKYYIAGIAADCGRGVTMTRCGNLGVIHNTTTMSAALPIYVAGVVAQSLPSSFSGCYNDGEIIIDSPKFGTCVAGILAYANNVANAETVLFRFDKCYNKAYINAGYNVAGILGEINYSRTIPLLLQMTECYNEGNIISSAPQKSNIAMGGVSCYYTPTSIFTGCYNTGTLQSDYIPYVGGIIGRYKVIADMNPKETHVDSCYNLGKIIATAGTGGGIMGQAHKSVVFNKCYNEGEITGKSTLGGIVGIMASESKILSCRNSGNVIVKEGSAAGIIPSNATQCEITACINTGNISSLTAAKATNMGGIAGSGASSFTDCVNLGNVEGLSSIGGIVGVPSKGKTALVNCYNAGNIKYENGQGGPLVGVDIENSTYWDVTTNSASNCWYVSNFISSVNSQPGSSVEMADMVAKNMGDGWSSADANFLPVPAVFKDNEAVIVAAAAVVPQQGQKYDALTANVSLGSPENVVWTSSADNVIGIDGNTAVLKEVNDVTPVILTATLGKYKREWVVANALPSGILTVEASNVADFEYYDITGTRIDKKMIRKGQIYLKVEKKSSGSKVTKSIMN